MRTLWLLTLLATPLDAQIRVYDAKTGQNVDAGLVSTTLSRETPPPQAQVAAPSPTVAKPLPQAVGTWTPSGTYVGRDLLENEVYLPDSPDDPVRTVAGEVDVFVRGADFSPIVVDRINEIKRIEGIRPVFYINDLAPQDYLGLLQKGFSKLAEGVELTNDGGGRKASQLGVTTANVIVYKSPNGAIRHYNLLTEIDTFRNALERVRYDQARGRK